MFGPIPHTFLEQLILNSPIATKKIQGIVIWYLKLCSFKNGIVSTSSRRPTVSFLTLRWRGGGGGCPQQVFAIFSGMGTAFSANYNFSCRLILGTSVHQKIFRIGPIVLALKVDKGRVLVGVATTPINFFSYFSNHEDDI